MENVAKNADFFFSLLEAVKFFFLVSVKILPGGATVHKLQQIGRAADRGRGLWERGVLEGGGGV